MFLATLVALSIGPVADLPIRDRELTLVQAVCLQYHYGQLGGYRCVRWGQAPVSRPAPQSFGGGYTYTPPSSSGRIGAAAGLVGAAFGILGVIGSSIPQQQIAPEPERGPTLLPMARGIVGTVPPPSRPDPGYDSNTVSTPEETGRMAVPDGCLSLSSVPSQDIARLKRAQSSSDTDRCPAGYVYAPSPRPSPVPADERTQVASVPSGASRSPPSAPAARVPESCIERPADYQPRNTTGSIGPRPRRNVPRCPEGYVDREEYRRVTGRTAPECSNVAPYSISIDNGIERRPRRVEPPAQVGRILPPCNNSAETSERRQTAAVESAGATDRSPQGSPGSRGPATSDPRQRLINEGLDARNRPRGTSDRNNRRPTLSPQQGRDANDAGTATRNLPSNDFQGSFGGAGRPGDMGQEMQRNSTAPRQEAMRGNLRGRIAQLQAAECEALAIEIHPGSPDVGWTNWHLQRNGCPAITPAQYAALPQEAQAARQRRLERARRGI